MVFRLISTDVKERLIYLADEGYVRDDILEFLGISESSFWRWKRNVRDHGTVLRPPSYTQGRPRLLTIDATKDLYQLLVEAPEMYLDEIQQWLVIAHDIGISCAALDENLRDCGLTYKLLSKAAAERDEDARNEFREFARETFVASQLVFVDETSKDNRTIYRHYGRSVSGRRATIHAPFARGVRYSIVAALSVDGYLRERIVEGSVNGDLFFDFIVDDLLPRMNKWPEPNSVIVLDNCAIHKSHALRRVVEASGQRLVFLPPYSPDLNPIEESFSSLKAYFRRHWKAMQDAEDPVLALQEACGHIAGENLVKGWYLHSGYRF